MIGFSLLRDISAVEDQASKYPTSIIPNEHVSLVPDNFDGRNQWGLYIRPPGRNKKFPSYSAVAKDVLNDRFTLLSGGQIEFDLDHFEILACKDDPPLAAPSSSSSANFLSSASNTSVHGYSIYHAWEFMFANGLSQLNCFSYQKLQELNIATPETIAFEQKINLYGFQCANIMGQGRTQCLSKLNGKPFAKRVFLPAAIYNVTDKTMTIQQKIAAIKYDLVKWGPVAAGFMVYENFVNSFKGLDVYSKVDGKLIGGHYVSILGWKDDYWICRNSWSGDWGLMGYFKVKMGIKDLALEDNISAVLPFLPYPQEKLSGCKGKWKGEDVSITDMNKFNPVLYQKRMALDMVPELFYTRKTVDLIRQGKLVGELTPLISQPKLLPNPLKYWVMDIQNFTFVSIDDTQSVSKMDTINSNMLNVITWWCGVILIIAVFVFVWNKK